MGRAVIEILGKHQNSDSHVDCSVLCLMMMNKIEILDEIKVSWFEDE